MTDEYTTYTSVRHSGINRPSICAGEAINLRTLELMIEAMHREFARVLSEPPDEEQMSRGLMKNTQQIPP
jgi:hypothetical protein